MTIPPPPPPGYIRTIKALAVQAVTNSFQVVYPEGQQPAFVSVEWPNQPQQVPGVWVDYEPAYLRTAGIDYTETDAAGHIMTRWRYQGYVTLTAMALSSNESDLLYDSLIAVTAFAAQSEALSPFRQAIDQNSLVACQWSFDTIDARGAGAMVGTPWGTDEPFWERGIAIQAIGEFVTSPVTQSLVNLSEIKITAVEELSGEEISDVIIVPRP